MPCCLLLLQSRAGYERPASLFHPTHTGDGWNSWQFLLPECYKLIPLHDRGRGFPVALHSLTQRRSCSFPPLLSMQQIAFLQIKKKKKNASKISLFSLTLTVFKAVSHRKSNLHPPKMCFSSFAHEPHISISAFLSRKSWHWSNLCNA